MKHRHILINLVFISEHNWAYCCALQTWLRNFKTLRVHSVHRESKNEKIRLSLKLVGKFEDGHVLQFNLYGVKLYQRCDSGK